jgi:transcriptional regulator with XRE-family HTH domain
MDISKHIISIRERKKIKQIEIAESLSMDRQNYSRLEKRGEKLTLEQLINIASALDVDLAEIIGIEVIEKVEIDKCKEENDKLNVILKDKIDLLNIERNKINRFSNEILEEFKSKVAHYVFECGAGLSYCVVNNTKNNKHPYKLRDDKGDSKLNLEALYSNTVSKEWIEKIGEYNKEDISLEFKIYDESYQKAFETYFKRMDDELVYYGDLELLWFLYKHELINDSAILETYESWLKKNNRI